MQIIFFYINNENFQRYLSQHAGGGCKSITFILVALHNELIIFVTHMDEMTQGDGRRAKRPDNLIY